MPVLNGRERRQARIAAAIALLGLAGCVENAPAPKAASPSVVDVKIEPQGNVEPDQARRLASLIAGETRRRNIPISEDERLDGVIDAGRAPEGLYLVTVIDVNNGKGKRLHRIVEDGVRPKGQTLSETDLMSIAVNAVKKLALWHGSRETTGSIGGEADVPALGPDDEIASASIAAILAAKPVFEIAMGPAPGNGAEELKAELAKELARTAPAGDAARYRVRGDVTLSSTEGGDVGIAIRWQVASADGRPIGTVIQTQETAPSRIASYWGDLAKKAAAPAADGILAMLKPAPMFPGNAS
jgi:hypothetical protein